MSDEFRSSREVLLDVTTLADDSGYLDLGVTLVSPDEDLLAYSVDTTGDEVFSLRFRDLRTGADLDDVVPRSYYGGAWSADSTWFFYTVHDHAYRPHEVWRHRIGTSVSEDVLVLSEPDERFSFDLRAGRSGEQVVIWSESRDTGESWVVDARAPESDARSVGGRRNAIVYRVEHVREETGPGHLLVVTNDDAVEFRLMRAPVPAGGDQDHTTWQEVRGENPAERLERVDAFAGHLVLSLRTKTEHRLRIVPVGDPAGPGIDVASRFPAGAVRLARSTSYDVDTVRISDQAYVEPPVWSDVDPATGQSTDLLRVQAPGHDSERYVTESMRFPAPDGTLVPATVIRHRDTPLDGAAPALIYAYGAYEYVFEPDWDPALPSLLDRGVVFVHAHVRGGGEGGRHWWLDGRLEHKQHSFDDHLAVADGLAGGPAPLVDGSRLASRGLSAGGLLQGVVFSQRPERWRAVVAEVPFVDVVTTMFDAETPLTVNEWDEWGDPRRREEFDWMLAYSPYDQLPPAGGRPDLLVTGAVHDPRVMVREPAKWVAALRAGDPEWSPRCLFRCELGAGAHVGPSGRFAHLDYEAEVTAWLLDRLGVLR
ncbi:S9 family peptidase [soil metagenome]